MGLEVPLWRAVAVYRVAALTYAVVLMANNYQRHPGATLGWVVIGGMAVWTGVPSGRTPSPPAVAGR